MKALIFNSGYGKRMGDFTKTHHKCQAVLKNGETILERQIRLLASCGITEFVITTGPFKEQIIATTKLPRFGNLKFTFVDNPIYDQTNYIYSMYLAKDLLNDDFLLLHGDLVFNRASVIKALNCPAPSTGMVNAEKALPEKDFKARVVDGQVREVSIHIFDDNCMAFQPLYKLDQATLQAWLCRVSEFIEKGVDGVYAENALNEIAWDLNIEALSYADGFVDEVDNLEDLARVSEAIRYFDYKEQMTLEGENSISDLADFLKLNCVKKPLIVCGRFEKTGLKDKFEAAGISGVCFGAYSPNPRMEEVMDGVKVFKENGCDGIISIGGGSAMDTAKNIKVLAAASAEEIKAFRAGSLPERAATVHVAIPTTAGTGAEATRFSVVYDGGEKKSIMQDYMLPDAVLLLPETILPLSDYQKKCTAMDSLCQCIESIWSVNKGRLNVKYAANGIKMILANLDAYLAGNLTATVNMQKAANLSGKAINLSLTTAAHAMSYKLTSFFGLPHGAAVALCLKEIWSYMAAFEEENEVLKKDFAMINEAFGCESTRESIEKFSALTDRLNLKEKPLTADEEKINLLASSVNVARLKNNPVALDVDTLTSLYRKITA